MSMRPTTAYLQSLIDIGADREAVRAAERRRTRRQRHADRLRDRADRLDPDGRFIRAGVFLVETPCCGKLVGPDPVGTPLWFRALDGQRQYDEELPVVHPGEAGVGSDQPEGGTS